MFGKPLRDLPLEKSCDVMRIIQQKVVEIMVLPSVMECHNPQAFVRDLFDALGLPAEGEIDLQRHAHRYNEKEKAARAESDAALAVRRGLSQFAEAWKKATQEPPKNDR